MTDKEKLEIYGRFVENLKKFNWDGYGRFLEEEDRGSGYVYDEDVKGAVEDLTWHLEADLAE